MLQDTDLYMWRFPSHPQAMFLLHLGLGAATKKTCFSCGSWYFSFSTANCHSCATVTLQLFNQRLWLTLGQIQRAFGKFFVFCFFFKCVLFFFWRIKYGVFGDLFFKCCFLCVFWHPCKLPTGKISLSLPGLHSVLNFGSDNSWKYFFSYWVLFRYGWETLKPWGSISVNRK